MIKLLKIIFKIFTRQFYIINAGFFLLGFILTFGITHPSEIILVHTSLIRGIVASNIFTLVVLLSWVMYALKCVIFCLKVIQQEDTTFLVNLQAVPAARQYFLLIACHISLYAPVLLYSCLIIGYALQAGLVLYSCGIISFQLAICIAGAVAVFNGINYSWKQSPAYLVDVPSLKCITPTSGLAGYFLAYTFHSRKLVFLATKFTGIFLLNIIFAWGENDFNIRSFILVFMIVVLIHAMLVYFYVDFMEKKLSFVRNLPVSRVRVFFPLA